MQRFILTVMKSSTRRGQRPSAEFAVDMTMSQARQLEEIRGAFATVAGIDLTTVQAVLLIQVCKYLLPLLGTSVRFSSPDRPGLELTEVLDEST